VRFHIYTAIYGEIVLKAVPEPVLPMVVLVLTERPVTADAVVLGLPNGRLGPPANDSGPPLEIKPLPIEELWL
jgi:hypothetical protein